MGDFTIHVRNTATGVGGLNTFAEIPIRIGRSSLNDLVLDHPSISQCHGVIREVDGWVGFLDMTFGEDLRMTNLVPTPRAPVALRPDDVLKLGVFVLTWMPTAAAASPPEAPTPPTGEKARSSPAPFPHADFPPPAAPTRPPTGDIQAPAAPRTEMLDPKWHVPAAAPAGPLAGPPPSSRAPLSMEIRMNPGLIAPPPSPAGGPPTPPAGFPPGPSPGVPANPAPAVPSYARMVGGTTQVPLASHAAQAKTPDDQLKHRLAHLTAVVPAGDQRRLLLRLLEVLEVSLSSLVALRDGQRQAATEVGAPSVEGSLFHEAKDGTALLNYLLEGGTVTPEGSARTRALSTMYSEVLLREVALIKSLRSGVDYLEKMLPPDARQAVDWQNVLAPQFNRVYQAALVGSNPMLHPRLPEAHPHRRNARLVVVAGGVAGASEGTTFPLIRQTMTIGRAPENDIVLPDISVSRQHARLDFLGTGKWRMTDLNSSNGLLIYGERVESIDLATGDHVEIGDLTVTYLDA